MKKNACSRKHNHSGFCQFMSGFKKIFLKYWYVHAQFGGNRITVKNANLSTQRLIKIS